MYSGLKSVRRERASLEHKRVVIESMIEDAKISDEFDSLDPNYFEGTSEDEIEELIKRIPESNEEDDQVDKVLNSNENLNMDEILGIDSGEDFEDDTIE